MPDEAEELREYERERQERIARRNALSWVIVGWVLAVMLALLAYDSAHAALDSHAHGRPWVYSASVSLLCTLALLALATRSLRRHLR
ncbi:MAG TPA: hypothetical protein VNW94_27765 [Streptosporangiaceae bacterium]|nr:hypothetical protein [Streptosporangiaceae bacterium]